MPPPRVRFTVEIDGVKRQLFSTFERSDGDIIILLKPSEFLDEPDAPDAESKRIVEQRISIHQSSESEQFTTIKQTLGLSSNQLRTMVALTNGPKNGEFGCALERRSIDVSDDDARKLPADAADNSTIINIGSYDPDDQTLFYGIYIGDSAVDFSVPEQQNIAIHQHVGARFRVVLLSSFANFPSHNSDETCNIFTLPPDQIPERKEDLEQIMQGISPIGCIGNHKACASFLTRKFIEKILPTTTNFRTAAMLRETLNNLGPVVRPLIESDIASRAARTETRGKPPNPR